MKTEKIDVIIPTYHPGKEFAALLECLEQQSCPVSRIIVMNTEEQFWDIKWEKEHPCLEVHHLKKKILIMEEPEDRRQSFLMEMLWFF